MSRRTPAVSPKARQLIDRFASRVEDYAYLGAAPPEDQHLIERGYDRAKLSLLAYIEELENRKPTAAAFVETK